MALLKALNERATEEGVRNFFEHEFKRIKAQAGMSYVDLKSPVISDMPGGPKDGNSTDEKLSYHVQAKTWLESVRRAINAMPAPEKHFLKLRYLDEMEWLDIEEKMNVTSRQGQYYIQRAFRYFADAFADTYDFLVFE